MLLDYTVYTHGTQVFTPGHLASQGFFTTWPLHLARTDRNDELLVKRIAQLFPYSDQTMEYHKTAMTPLNSEGRHMVIKNC